MTTQADKAIVRPGENRSITVNYHRWTAMAPTFARRAVVRRSPCKKGGARGEHTRRRAQASRIRLPIGPDKGGTPPPFRLLIIRLRSLQKRLVAVSWRRPSCDGYDRSRRR